MSSLTSPAGAIHLGMDTSKNTIIDPGKRAPLCPVRDGPGLPAQPEPLVLALIGSDRLRPGHYRQGARQPVCG
jgi:hypothetical protein